MNKSRKFWNCGKTKKVILTIELTALIILSVFLTSMFGANSHNSLPIASASANLINGKAPLNVDFKGSGSDNDGFILSYFWDFGDGTTSRSQSTTHTYVNSGRFIAILTVTDNKGAIGKNQITINVQENIQDDINPADQVKYLSNYFYTDFVWSPEYPDVGEKVTFRYTSYYFWGFGFKTWNFGDGTFGWGSVVTHTYNKKGSYIVTLTVANGEDYGYSSHEIKIGASPFPKFTYLPNEPKPGENVYFDASESRDINGEIVKYNWSYTESKDPNKIIQMGSNISFTYNWNEQGNYKVKLAVTDDDGNSNQITKTIVISILRIDAIKGGFRNLDFQITNRGNITAENIQWKVYANRLVLFLPLWKIFSKTGTISMLQPGQSKSIDIGRYRRGLGRISVTVIVEGSNAERITKSFQGFIFSKFILTRSKNFS